MRTRSFELDAEQKIAKKAVMSGLDSGLKRILVVGPTGMGKTAIYLDLLEDMARSGTGGPSAIFTERGLFANQIIHSEAPKFAEALNAVGAFQRFRPSSFNANALIQVATYYSGIRGLQNRLLKQEDLNLIILDEAHHALSDLRQAILSDPDATYIAFTATPSYYQSKGLAELGFKTVYHRSKKQGVELGISSPVRNIILTPEDLDFTLDDIGIERGDFSGEKMERLLSSAPLIHTLANFIRDWKNPNTGKPLYEEVGIINCSSINHARMIVAPIFNSVLSPLMPDGTTFCEPVWGAMPGQKDVLDRHRSGRTKTAASANFMIEGYDNDRVTYVLNIRPTMSAVVADQRNRIRMDRENPERMGLMIDVAYPAGRKAQLFYSDAVEGVLFERTSFSSKTGERKIPELPEPPQILPGLGVHYEVEEVLNYKRQSETARAKLLDPDFAAMPEHRAKWMLKRGFRTLEDVYQAIQAFAFAQGWLKEKNSRGPHGEFTRRKVTALMLNHDAAYTGGVEYTRLAIAVSRVLNVHPLQLFGSIPKEIQAIPPEAKTEKNSLRLDDKIGKAGRLKEVFESLDEENPEHAAALSQFDIMTNRSIEANERQLQKMAWQTLRNLTPREERVLRMRFGINISEMTLNEAGEELFMTSSRIAQIEAKALRKLKHPSRSARLRPLLDLGPPKQNHITSWRHITPQQELAKLKEKSAQYGHYYNQDRIIELEEKIARMEELKRLEAERLAAISQEAIDISLGYFNSIARRVEASQIENEEKHFALSQSRINLDEENLACYYDGQAIKLSEQNFWIVSCLAKNPGSAIEADKIAFFVMKHKSHDYPTTVQSVKSAFYEIRRAFANTGELFTREANGNVYSYREILPQIKPLTPVPTLSKTDRHLF